MALKQQIFGVFQKLRTFLPRGSNLPVAIRPGTEGERV